jgi:hypothetical protein
LSISTVDAGSESHSLLQLAGAKERAVPCGVEHGYEVRVDQSASDHGLGVSCMQAVAPGFCGLSRYPLHRSHRI